MCFKQGTLESLFIKESDSSLSLIRFRSVPRFSTMARLLKDDALLLWR
jgi:hypothetical protein